MYSGLSIEVARKKSIKLQVRSFAPLDASLITLFKMILVSSRDAAGEPVSLWYGSNHLYSMGFLF